MRLKNPKLLSPRNVPTAAKYYKKKNTGREQDLERYRYHQTLLVDHN